MQAVTDPSCPVVILCGGQGTRMSDVSRVVPKPMLPIGGMPILWHIMKMYSHQGFNNFVLCLGHLGDVIEDFFTRDTFEGRAILDLDYRLAKCSERWEPGWRITFARTGEWTPTGGRLKCIENLIDGDDFMLTYGDGLSDVRLDELLQCHRRLNRTATLTGVRARAAFGLLDVKDGVATTFVEKPLLEKRVNGGFFVFKREIFGYLASDEALEETPLLTMVERGELAVYEHDGFWYSMDTKKDFDALNAMWTNGQSPWKCW
jgi:glucose-1-phosphate cytidylyltransferase